MSQGLSTLTTAMGSLSYLPLHLWKTKDTDQNVMVVPMSERRVISDQEIIGLVTKLRSLEWPLSADEVEQMVEAFEWKIMARPLSDFILETEFGFASGKVEIDGSDRVERIRFQVCTAVDTDDPGNRAFIQDAFAGVSAAVTQVLGEPTQRIPGEDPELRWRGAESTIAVMRLPIQVDMYMAANESVDAFDWAVSRGL